MHDGKNNSHKMRSENARAFKVLHFKSCLLIMYGTKAINRFQRKKV